MSSICISGSAAKVIILVLSSSHFWGIRLNTGSVVSRVLMCATFYEYYLGMHLHLFYNPRDGTQTFNPLTPERCG